MMKSLLIAALTLSSLAHAGWSIDQIDEGKALLINTSERKTKVVDVSVLPKGAREGMALTDEFIADAAKEQSFRKLIAKKRAELKAEKTATAAK
jgi:hypothetical protein